MYEINKLHHLEGTQYGIFAFVGLYQKCHWFAVLIRSISDTSPTRAKMPYACPPHEVIYI